MLQTLKKKEMKKMFFLLAFIVSVLFIPRIHAQVFVQLFPVTDTLIKKFDHMVFGVDSNIRHYNVKGKVDLRIEKTMGQIWIFTFASNTPEGELEDNVHFKKCENSPTGWCITSYYESEKYIPALIKKVVEMLHL
jgi:hypothetical protein